MSSVPDDHEAIVAVPSAEDRPTRVGSGLSKLRRRLTSNSAHPRLASGLSRRHDHLSVPEAPPAATRWAASDLDRLVHGQELGLETYGLSEYRDGFFDALFLRPRPADRDELQGRADEVLPPAFRRRHPLSIAAFFPRQRRDLARVLRALATTRAGIKLAKSCLAVLAAYFLCLAPPVRRWLGPRCYLMVVSAVLNHPGRSVGAQLDGAVSTVLGTATGLGWGAFGLWLSTSTADAAVGYAAVLATFIALYIGAMAALRACFGRSYQFVICAGMAVCYACLDDVSGFRVQWPKLVDYGVPWALGQGLCLVVCIVFFPDAGARRLAVSLDDALGTMLASLDDPTLSPPTRQHLAQTFVNLSHAYRDLAIDFSVTLFRPPDVRELRNRLQAVIRGILAMRPKPMHSEPADEAVRLVRHRLEDPTDLLLGRMQASLRSCHAVLMHMSGYGHLGTDEHLGTDDLLGALVKLRKAMLRFDGAESSLLDSDELPAGFVPDVVRIFAYCRPIRQAATAIEAVLVTVNEMEQRRPAWPRIHAPSYPWRKALDRTNPQVRHDRGGVTAGSYYRSFAEIGRAIQNVQDSEHPLPKPDLFRPDSSPPEAKVDAPSLRHSVWQAAHQMQGFEMRFALKTVIVTSALSIPAFLDVSRGWWNRYDAWWAVAMAWIMMHPRVGGNLQDLVTRALMGVLGAAWGAAAYAAGGPYVMGVFAAIYLVPMMYRLTQSTHPRSGLVGCLSFVVTSLALVEGRSLDTTVGRGLAFVVGVVASVVINWALWPFVARHELRKALSATLFFLSIIYRSIIAKYIYYEAGHQPTPEDVQRSEILEGRLREGFVRIRQLTGLTRHEIRLRAPFDPLPYSALAGSCERFFEYLVAVRQSSLFFHPRFVRGGDSDTADAVGRLLIYRRDAVASIIDNLYTLAGALRTGRKVPKYLPSSAASRKRLMDKMVELEAEYAAAARRKEAEEAVVEEQVEPKKWVQIYSFSYNESLTGCVAELEELERYTKLAVGEGGFDDFSDSDD